MLNKSPSVRSSNSEDSKEVAVVKADNTTFKLKQLNHIDTVNAKIEYEEHNTKRHSDKSVTKILFNNHNQLEGNITQNIKRINKVITEVCIMLDSVIIVLFRNPCVNSKLITCRNRKESNINKEVSKSHGLFVVNDPYWF